MRDEGRSRGFGEVYKRQIYGCSSTVAPIAFFSSLPKGATLIEQVDVQPEKVMKHYVKYQNDNGPAS